MSRLVCALILSVALSGCHGCKGWDAKNPAASLFGRKTIPPPATGTAASAPTYPSPSFPPSAVPPGGTGPAAGSLAGDASNQSWNGSAGGASSWVPSGSSTLGGSSTAAPANDPIRVATFNIQVFGTSKLAKPEVMDVLAKVVRRYDVVAVQEIRSKDETVIPRFLELINAEGARYDFVIGPRLGRTSSKEQYVFLYDTERIALDAGSVYTADDPADQLHREPLVARFMVRGAPGGTPFSFKLVNIHTDPDETDQELDALDDVFTSVQRDGSGEDDVILLGDLNVDEYDLGQLGMLPGIDWVVRGTTTNTRRDHAYDNIVMQRQATSEYTGRWGVLDLEAEYGLTREQALEVSDHLPVWAEFSPSESASGSPLATRPTSRPR